MNNKKYLYLTFLIIFFSPLVAQAEVESFKHIYPNGLTLYFTKNKTLPNFYAAVVVNAGGKEGPRKLTGMAHYLEHLLFKGNSKIGSLDYKKERQIHNQIVSLYDQKQNEKSPQKREALNQEINRLSLEEAKYGNATEFQSLFASIGNEVINAYTSENQTVYISQMANNRFSKWAQFESERYKDPIFRTFQWELEIVYEEKNIRLADVENLARNKIANILYPDHNFANTIGSIEHLKSPSIQAVYDFFNEYYVAENMAIIISGDLNFEMVKEVVGDNFAFLSQAKRPIAVELKASDLVQKKIVEINKVTEPMVYIGFKIPGPLYEDHFPLTIIDMMMDNSRAGLINLNIVKNQVLSNAGSYPISYGAKNSIQYFYGQKSNDQTFEFIEQTLLKELEKIKSGQFSQELLDAVILDLKIAHQKKLESNKERVRLLSDHFSYKSDGSILNTYSSLLDKITKKKIVEVAKKYFNKNYVLVKVSNRPSLEDKILKPQISELPDVIYPESKFASDIKGQIVAPISPQTLLEGEDYQKQILEKNTTLFYGPNLQNDLAKFTVRFKRGYLELSNALYWKNLYSKFSINGMNADQLASDFYKLGVTVNLDVLRDTTTLVINGPKENIEKALELSLKTLFTPVISQELINKDVKDQIEIRKLKLNKINSVSSAGLEYLRYFKKSKYLKMTGEMDLLELKPSDYVAFSDSLKKVERDYIYVGSESQESIATMINKYFSHSELEQGQIIPNKRENDLKRDRIFFYHFTNAKQANIYFYKKGPLYQPENFVEQMKAKVFNFYWGFSSLYSQLLIEIREKKALAYTAWALFASEHKRFNPRTPRTGSPMSMRTASGISSRHASPRASWVRSKTPRKCHPTSGSTQVVAVCAAGASAASGRM